MLPQIEVLTFIFLNLRNISANGSMAVTTEEFAKLIQSAITNDKTIQCYTGKERARIYLLSNRPGLRRKEIASLTPRSFKLDANPATVTVEA